MGVATLPGILIGCDKYNGQHLKVWNQGVPVQCDPIVIVVINNGKGTQGEARHYRHVIWPAS